MAIPWNIRGSASQLLFQDKESPQHQALLAIADVPHPDRSILAGFINDAFDPQEAARYFLHMTCSEDGLEIPPRKTKSQFLAEWRSLVDKFRPTLATSLSSETKMLVCERDACRCCLTHTPFKSYLDHDLEYVHIVPPCVLSDPDLSEETALFQMLSSFLSRDLLEVIRNLQHEGPEKVDNVWMLSKQAWNAFQTGEVFLTSLSCENHSDNSQQQTYYIDTNDFQPQQHTWLVSDEVILESRTPQLAPIVSEDLLGIHARFSKSLAWIETKKYMDASRDDVSEKIRNDDYKMKGRSFLPSLISPFSLFRRFWTTLPSFFRAAIYDVLLRVGSRIYGPSLSMTVFRLPFGLYLRRGSPNLAPKYHVEAHTLRMIEQSTCIPAPRAIDVLETPRFSYLLMTRVPGRPIGQILYTMTDEQVKQAVIDLKKYVSELRKIPGPPGEYQICNSQGGGFLDWRIPDSQREELRFKSEADFNKYLTDPFGEKTRRDAAKSHDICHRIFFTHGDLNPRNILAEGGRITGIVDWENAGWFPEYWEYTKAHYTVRSVMRWLADVVDVVFEGYRDELHVENMLSDLLGPF